MPITKLPKDMKELKDLNVIKGLIDERVSDRHVHRQERSVASVKIKGHDKELSLLRKQAEKLLGINTPEE